MCNAFECFLQFEHFTGCSITEYQSTYFSQIKLSILKHLPIMQASCQQNTLAYYAFYHVFDYKKLQDVVNDKLGHCKNVKAKMHL